NHRRRPLEARGLQHIALAEVLEDPGLALAERLDQRRQVTGRDHPADAYRHRIGPRRGHPESAGQDQAQDDPASLHPRSIPMFRYQHLSRAGPQGNRRAPGMHERVAVASGTATTQSRQPRYEAKEGTMPVLQDKAVLVTGAGAGIGRATALAMAAEGAIVAAADIDLAAAERTAGLAAGNSGRAIAIEADCGDVASI